MSEEQPNQNLSAKSAESGDPSQPSDFAGAAGGSRGSVKQPLWATMPSTQNFNLEWNAPILLTVFGLIGLGALSMGIGHGCYTLIRVSGAQRVEGIVVEFVEQRSRGADGNESVRVPIVEYSMAGQRHRIPTNDESSWRLGRKMPVLVRPDRPAEGVVDSFAEKWMVTLIGCVIGFPPLLYAAFGLVSRMRTCGTP